MGILKDVDLKEFESIIDSEKNIVVVDFWAKWCGPCRVLGPTLQTVSEELENVTILKVDVDNNAELSAKFGIRNIPTVLIFKNGEIVDKFIGPKSKEDIVSMIEKNYSDSEIEK